MKTKAAIGLGLFIQCVFLVVWLFRTPEIWGHLKVVRDELKKGDADLPALAIQNADMTTTTVAYDPSKSASENLIARTSMRLSIVSGRYESIVGLPPILVLLNVILLSFLLLSLRTKPTHAAVQAI